MPARRNGGLLAALAMAAAIAMPPLGQRRALDVLDGPAVRWLDRPPRDRRRDPERQAKAAERRARRNAKRLRDWQRDEAAQRDRVLRMTGWAVHGC